MRGSKKSGTRSKISDRTWSEVKAAYYVGKEPIGTIATKHNISRKSIERRAKADSWKYGVLSDEVAKEVERATIETIIEKDVDIASRVTKQFIQDSQNLRVVTIAIQTGMVKELKKSGGAVSRAEAERIYFSQRVNETTYRIIKDIYYGMRKALGIEIDAEVKKQHLLEQPASSVIDPTEGMSNEDVDEKLKEMESEQ